MLLTFLKSKYPEYIINYSINKGIVVNTNTTTKTHQLILTL